jgi:hypothetical protein
MAMPRDSPATAVRVHAETAEIVSDERLDRARDVILGHVQRLFGKLSGSLLARVLGFTSSIPEISYGLRGGRWWCNRPVPFFPL